MKKFILSLLMALGFAAGAVASEAGMPLDRFPVERLTNPAALQNGAKLFVNYCLNCHSASYVRFNRMRDLGLTEEQIKQNLLFTTDKVGDVMRTSLDPRQAKEWFGAQPPDLSVIARSRAGLGGTGPDYLYTYLRSYYKDETKPTGWNNLAFPNVGMPHALWQLQGVRTANFKEVPDAHDPSKKTHQFVGFEQVTPGKLSSAAYDEAVADLVAYLTWMGEPAAGQRVRLGVAVLVFLSILTFIAWRLNAAFWKDVK